MSGNINNSNSNNNNDGFCDDVSKWSREQDKAFEDAIATFDGIINNDKKWEMIASVVPGNKPVDEIKHHYEMLVDDVVKIESGFVPLPCYNSSGFDDQQSSSGDGSVRAGAERKVGRSEHERRKGIAWSEDEHRLFLLGLEKYGKGDWRSISRNFVVSRTPTQVASHAQKYFIRLNSMNKERRRTSIHDITSAVIDNEADGLFRPQ